MKSTNKQKIRRRKKGFLALCLTLVMLFTSSTSIFAQNYDVGWDCEYLAIGTHLYINDTIKGSVGNSGEIFFIYDNSGDNSYSSYYDPDLRENIVDYTETITNHGVSGLLYWNVDNIVPADYENTFETKVYLSSVRACTVTFQTAHAEAPVAETVAPGEKITNPGDLSASGYIFGGWYKEAACTTPWDFANDTVSSSITLYAKWTAETPATPDPDTEEPSTEEPSTEEPSTEEPSTETPSTEEPSTETPSGETPVTPGTTTEENTSTETEDIATPAVDISKAKVTLNKTSYTYTGSAFKPTVKVVVSGKKLKKNTDYKVSYKNNTNAGKATVVIKGKGNYTGTVKKTFTIKKAAVSFSKTSASYKYSTIKTKAKSFNLLKSTKYGKVTVSYKSYGKISKTKCKKYISVTSKGKVTVKKGAPKGVYKFVVTVASNTNYNKASKSIKVTVK